MSKSLSLLLTLAVSASTLTACKTTRIQADTAAPAYAATADIKLKENKTGNGALTIEIEYLAPPQKIENHQAYVAWALVKDKEPVKLGALEYNEKKRHGELHATTPLKEFQLKITLEKKAETLAPGGRTILDKKVKAKF